MNKRFDLSDCVTHVHYMIFIQKAMATLSEGKQNLINFSQNTHLLANAKEVFDDLDMKRYVRRTADTLVTSTKAKAEGEYHEGDEIKFDDVLIQTPDHVVKMGYLTFTLKPGMNCLFYGEETCGKSSIFKVLFGLWPHVSGDITRPPLDDMLYLPQFPYIFKGSLRTQIIYPHTKEEMEAKGITDDDVTKQLQRVWPAQMVEKFDLDQTEDWEHKLTIGEKQRLGIARALYHKPKFVILDDCANSLSLPVEKYLMAQLQANRITMLTVSHREELIAFHDYIFRIASDTSWTFSRILRP